MLSTTGVMLIAIAISARHRVATAADLSALAAASALASTQLSSSTITTETEQACRAARDIAEANGARLSECQIEGGIVDVQTTITMPAIGYLGSQSVSAHARAGPS
jgi:secretion/DNA translocation related TadE-like protein